MEIRLTRWLFLFACISLNSLFAQNKEFELLKKKQQDTLYVKLFAGSPRAFYESLKGQIEIRYKLVSDLKDTLENTGWQTHTPMLNLQQFRKDSVKFELLTAYMQPSPYFDSAEIISNYGFYLVEVATNKQLSELIGNTIKIKIGNPKSDKYVFQLFRNSKKLKSEIIDCQEAKVNGVVAIAKNPMIYEKRKVMIRWDHKLSPEYVTFELYRSEDGKKYIRLNDNPLLPSFNPDAATEPIAEFLDKKVEKGKTYYYKLSGNDYFGEHSAYSEVVKVKLPLTVDAVGEIDTITTNGVSRIITFSIYPTDSVQKPSIAKAILFRSDSLNGIYMPLKSMNLTENLYHSATFKIEGQLKSGDSYYYKIAILSSDNDTSFSRPYYFFTLDQEPPGIVTEFKGAIDSTGIVTLSWKKPADNDLRGYRIFKGNQINEEFSEVTKQLSTETTLRDTLALNYLTNQVYYTVVAVDQNYNHSPFSDTIMIIKPDTIPPVSAAIYDINGNKEGIHLKWHQSTDAELFKNYLIRRKDTHIDTLFDWGNQFTSFSDTTVLSGNTYFYSIITLDKSKNRKQSQEYPITYELGYRPSVKNIQQKIDRANKCIELSWNYDNKDVYSYSIYKAKEGESLILYKTITDLEQFNNVFRDNKLTINTTFHYRIKANLKSGISTEISEEIIVNY